MASRPIIDKSGRALYNNYKKVKILRRLDGVFCRFVIIIYKKEGNPL